MIIYMHLNMNHQHQPPFQQVVSHTVSPNGDGRRSNRETMKKEILHQKNKKRKTLCVCLIIFNCRNIPYLIYPPLANILQILKVKDSLPKLNVKPNKGISKIDLPSMPMFNYQGMLSLGFILKVYRNNKCFLILFWNKLKLKT